MSPLFRSLRFFFSWDPTKQDQRTLIAPFKPEVKSTLGKSRRLGEVWPRKNHLGTVILCPWVCQEWAKQIPIHYQMKMFFVRSHFALIFRKMGESSKCWRAPANPQALWKGWSKVIDKRMPAIEEINRLLLTWSCNLGLALCIIFPSYTHGDINDTT